MRSPTVPAASVMALCVLLAAAPASADYDPAAATTADDDAETAIAAQSATTLRDFSTDRPDVTESPFTVNAGHIQIETTLFGYTRSPRDVTGVATDAYEFGTTNLRVGVTERLELNVVWQPYGIVDPRGAGITERGIGSVDLRAKLNLWGNDGLERPGDTAFALLPYVTLPTDSTNGIGSNEVAFGLIVPLSVQLGGGFGLGLNAAANFTRQRGGQPYDAAVLTSASLGYEWNDKLATYAEVVWEFSRGAEGDVVTLDSGVTYALGPNWQVDAGVNIGVTSAADPLAPFIGLSARF